MTLCITALGIFGLIATLVRPFFARMSSSITTVKIVFMLRVVLLIVITMNVVAPFKDIGQFDPSCCSNKIFNFSFNFLCLFFSTSNLLIKPFMSVIS